MQRLVVSGAVRPIYGSLGVKRLKYETRRNLYSLAKQLLAPQGRFCPMKITVSGCKGLGLFCEAKTDARTKIFWESEAQIITDQLTGYGTRSGRFEYPVNFQFSKYCCHRVSTQ